MYPKGTAGLFVNQLNPRCVPDSHRPWQTPGRRRRAHRGVRLPATPQSGIEDRTRYTVHRFVLVLV